MTTLEIKALINAKEGIVLPTLSFQRQFGEDKVTPQPWVSHWDNDHRIRITMHEDVMAILKANPMRGDLAVKDELVAATDTRAQYKRYIIIVPKNIEYTF